MPTDSTVPLTRRQLLARSAGALAGAALAAAAGPLVGCRRGPRPDVLFVVADDLNDWVGFLGGHPQAQTPNLDRLARRGVAFRNAHCPSPLCNPSRTSVLTGIPPWRHGIYGNGVSFRRVLPGARTLPQVFRDGGYRVLGGGKIFHTVEDDRDTWDAYEETAATASERKHRGLSRSFDWGPVDVPLEQMHDGKLARWAAGQWRDTKGPLFLAVGFTGPHLPWLVPREIYRLYDPATVTMPEVPPDDLDDVPPQGIRLSRYPSDVDRQIEAAGSAREAVAAYLAAVHAFDTAIGPLVEAIDARPDAVVVFWSDHGFHLGEKRHWRKWTLWEESTRVPLIVAAPEARAGAVCDQPANLQGLYPLLVGMCGLEAEIHPENKSLRPLLADPAAAVLGPAAMSFRKDLALRSERWRYIRYWNGDEELYDHQQDPGEWHNLAGRPEVAAVSEQLAALLPADPQYQRLSGEQPED